MPQSATSREGPQHRRLNPHERADQSTRAGFHDVDDAELLMLEQDEITRFYGRMDVTDAEIVAIEAVDANRHADHPRNGATGGVRSKPAKSP